jgi:hypothetical protein
MIFFSLTIVLYRIIFGSFCQGVSLDFFDLYDIITTIMTIFPGESCFLAVFPGNVAVLFATLSPAECPKPLPGDLMMIAPPPPPTGLPGIADYQPKRLNLFSQNTHASGLNHILVWTGGIFYTSSLLLFLPVRVAGMF